MSTKRPYIISPSFIHGYGVIANQIIKSGEAVHLPRYKTKLYRGFNHSCNFNSIFCHQMKKFYVLRDIKIGDELTVDYGKRDAWIPNPCLCQSKYCRGK